MMDCKKKYEQALERATQSWECGDMTREHLEYLFPELAEPEDEKIRKVLIGYFKSYREVGTCGAETFNGISTDNIIAWLEKQCEQKPYGQRKKCFDCQFNYAGECKGSCQMKRDEQKTADKVEPKFHEGDWVILTVGELSTTIQIVKVDTNKKLYWFNDSSYLPIVDEECLHLWNIRDAKDGDVLVDICDDFANPLIFILKKFEHKDFGLAKLSDYSSYCYLTMSNSQNFKEGFYHHMHNIHPATKEQRDTLERAMTNAGYRWNKEELKLEKI